MNNSNRSQRRQKILDSLGKCDSRDTRESLLLDEVICLQDSLFELQQAFAELSIMYRRIASSPIDLPLDVYVPDYNKK